MLSLAHPHFLLSHALKYLKSYCVRILLFSAFGCCGCSSLSFPVLGFWSALLSGSTGSPQSMKDLGLNPCVGWALSVFLRLSRDLHTLYVSPVILGRPVRGVSRLLPNDSWKRLQPPFVPEEIMDIWISGARPNTDITQFSFLSGLLGAAGCSAKITETLVMFRASGITYLLTLSMSLSFFYLVPLSLSFPCFCLPIL